MERRTARAGLATLALASVLGSGPVGERKVEAAEPEGIYYSQVYNPRPRGLYDYISFFTAGAGACGIIGWCGYLTFKDIRELARKYKE